MKIKKNTNFTIELSTSELRLLRLAISKAFRYEKAKPRIGPDGPVLAKFSDEETLELDSIKSAMLSSIKDNFEKYY